MLTYQDIFGDILKKEQQRGNFLYYKPEDVMTTSNTYPNSTDYEYESSIELINFDEECAADIAMGKGFIVAPAARNIKKDLKAEDGIYSTKFGQTLADTNPFIDRYRCKCKNTEPKRLRGRINNGIRCPICGAICRYVDDDFSYFGWITLNDPFKIIHPAIYKKLESFFGKGISIQGKKRTKLENMLDISELVSPLSAKMEEQRKKDEPYFGIGMLEFINRFDEIMSFYLKKKPQSRMLYDDIYIHKALIFTHSIPVFTTLLRPVDIKEGKMTYEPCNAMYSMMNKLRTSINKVDTRMQREPKIKNNQLFNLQKKYMELYGELENILSGKKGDFRCLIGGRYNFSSRNVIVQNPNLRIDEVTLPVIGLTVMLEQRIKNILCRMYNMTPNEAHSIWYKATISPDPKISAIIQSIIDDYKAKGIRGIPILINRNPTISYGSFLQMFCVGFTNTFTMALPTQVLKSMGADFDGDVLNILLPTNQTFIRLCWEKFNPRNVLYISRNDGYFNTAASMQRDTLINSNTLARVGRDSYTQEDINAFDNIIALQKQMELVS